MDALDEARTSLESFHRSFTNEGKVFALAAISSALIAIAEELRAMNERAEQQESPECQACLNGNKALGPHHAETCSEYVPF